MNLGFLALTLPFVAGQPVALPPVTPPAPFTFVKVFGPIASKTTWQPGSPLAVATKEPTAVALRPGYSYRFELSCVGVRGTETIWPSIEVRGSLVPKPNLNPADHPVPIFLAEDDVERILEGRFVTKVYYLEDPNQAVNGPQPLGVPLEESAVSEEEAVKEARKRGRLMIIVRAGERLWTPEELATENVPGTVWIPSKSPAIPIPVAAPTLPFTGVAFFDPLLGPKQLTGECLHDGGDRFDNLGIGRGDKLYGLDPSDTALEFNTSKGKKVATSNQVCVCIPRFAVQRVEQAPLSQHAINGPRIGVLAQPPRVTIKKVPPLDVVRIEQPINVVGPLRASGLVLETGPLVKQQLIGRPLAMASHKGVKIHAQFVEAEDITGYCDCPLVLMKRMDPPNPKQIGEIVTFFLAYRNPGAQPMTDLVVSDSLTGRLEYLEGTAKSDRAATFTATPNEAGSVVLRWAIDGPLLPGQRGVVSFQARIR
jgi:uncharacterized repeat protein (TIGR01451 family)